MSRKSNSKAKVLVVTSGKGGVGKTTSSASIAMGLAQQGFKTAVLDFDIGLRNLDIVMGCERRVVYDFVGVINGKAKLEQALINDKRNENLFILAASQTDDKDSLTQEGVKKIINELKSMKFDYIVCDSPAGIEAGALHAMYYADEAIIVVNPEVSSIRDSDRVIGLLDAKTFRAGNGDKIEKHLLVVRYDQERVKNGQMLSLDDINDILSINLIGVIPESQDVIDSSNQGAPVIIKEKSLVAEAYMDCVKRLTGQKDLPFRNLNNKKGFLSKLFGG